MSPPDHLTNGVVGMTKICRIGDVPVIFVKLLLTSEALLLHPERTDVEKKKKKWK